MVIVSRVCCWASARPQSCSAAEVLPFLTALQRLYSGLLERGGDFQLHKLPDLHRYEAGAEGACRLLQAAAGCCRLRAVLGQGAPGEAWQPVHVLKATRSCSMCLQCVAAADALPPCRSRGRPRHFHRLHQLVGSRGMPSKEFCLLRSAMEVRLQRARCNVKMQCDGPSAVFPCCASINRPACLSRNFRSEVCSLLPLSPAAARWPWPPTPSRPTTAPIASLVRCGSPPGFLYFGSLWLACVALGCRCVCLASSLRCHTSQHTCSTPATSFADAKSTSTCPCRPVHVHPPRAPGQLRHPHRLLGRRVPAAVAGATWLLLRSSAAAVCWVWLCWLGL